MIAADYIVVGAGASGISFADTIVSNSDFSVAIVDVNSAPGGSWRYAHDFMQLDLPIDCAGVNSVPVGIEPQTRPQTARMLTYYDEVITDRLLASDQVQYFSDCYHLGAGLVHAVGWNTRVRFDARRKIVDATQCWHRTPARETPAFASDPDVLMITPNDLSSVWSVAAGLHRKYCVLGAGNAAVDTVSQLLSLGVNPDQICWVKPRDSWFLNRESFTPRAWLNTLQAISETRETGRLLTNLEQAGHLVRIFRDQTPTMFHANVQSNAQLAPLREITHVVRKGRIQSLSSLGIILDDGVEPMPERTLYIDCTTSRVEARPRPAVFEDTAITIQMLQIASAEFSGALTAITELLDLSDGEKNRLCTPLSLPDTAADFARVYMENLRNKATWLTQPGLHEWLAQNRLGSAGKFLSSILSDPANRGFADRQIQHLMCAAANILDQDVKRNSLPSFSVISEPSRPHLRTVTEPD